MMQSGARLHSQKCAESSGPGISPWHVQEQGGNAHHDEPQHLLACTQSIHSYLLRPPSSYRTTLRSNRFFCLQKKKSSTLMNTLDSLRAAKSSPFRILVQISKADFSYVIAVGTSEQEIEADWAWLEENLLGVLDN
ncbi:hypothetical protein EMCRGX_G010886 [Ephydatia muelleri]